MKQQDWTQKLREKLADYEVKPADNLWADIEARLDKPVAAKRSLWPVIMRRLGIAAAVTLLVAGGAYLLMPQKPDTNTKETASLPKTVSKAIDAKKCDFIEEKEAFVKSVKRVNTTIMASTEPKVVNLSASTSEASATDTMSSVSESPEVEKQPSTSVEVNRQIALNDDNWTVKQSKTRRSRFVVGYYGASATGSGTSITTPVMMSSNQLQKYVYTSGLEPAASRSSLRAPSQSPVYLLNYREYEHHNLPFAIGLSLGYQLSDRWTLTTGVVLTMLSSEYTTQMKNDFLRKKQSLNYIGIPLNVKFRIWQIQRLSFYATAGLQADINVKAKIESSGKPQYLKGIRPQYSTQLSVGAQYDAFSHLGIYVEPGMRYYFNNGGQLRSYFTEHPLGVNLQAGLRINF